MSGQADAKKRLALHALIGALDDMKRVSVTKLANGQDWSPDPVFAGASEALWLALCRVARRRELSDLCEAAGILVADLEAEFGKGREPSGLVRSCHERACAVSSIARRLRDEG